MPSNVLPTLSTSGWVTAVSEKADRLLAYFFEADGLQSSLYKERVYSLPFIISQYDGDPHAITREVQTKLSSYLLQYFDGVEVQAEHEVDESSRINIKIYAKLSEKGKDYSLGKLVVLADNNISKVISLNN